MNLPDYNFLPAPLWMITSLHVLTLTLHFVAMNFLVGGLFVILFGGIEGRRNHAVVKRFVALFPTAMAATVTLGVAPLLFAQLVYHRQLYAASIVSGWYWFGIIGAAIAGYYFLYAAAFSKTGRGTRGFLMAALAAFVYISFVYSTVFSMAEKPDVYKALYAASASGDRINPDVVAWVWRWPHMLLGAVTVGGFFVALLGKDDERIFAVGRKVFLVGMIATMLVGLGFLLSKLDHLRAFMRSAGIWWLSAAVLLSLGSLHFFFKRRFLPAGIMIFVSMLGMVMVRHVFRLIELGDRLDPGSVPIHPQWSVFALFLVCFILALGLSAWMLRIFFASRRKTGVAL